MSESPPTPGTVFSWPGSLRLRWTLIGFLLLSLAIHASMFFIFQVLEPVRLSPPPPAPPVLLLTPATPEGQALLAWAEAEDPGLSAATARAVPPTIGEVRYTPSWMIPRTAPRTVPLPDEAGKPVGLIQPLEWARRLAPPPPEQSSEGAMRELPIRLDGDLAGRAILHRPAMPSRPLPSADASTWLAGVQPDGTLAFAFLQRRSGESPVDLAIGQMVQALRFTPAEKFTWGFITVTGM